ncbi:MAG: LysE family transporter [Polyangiaceae bacterium]
MILALIIGLVFAFFGSIPIAGPIAVVVLSRGLEHRGRAGLFIAMGAAVAEAIYAFLAFWGFSAVLTRFPSLVPATRLVGCVILISLGLYLALKTPKSKEAAQDKDKEGVVGVRNLLLGFTMTIVNPTLIVTWTAAVSAAHSSGILELAPRNAFPFSIGVCAGIILWFAILLALLAKFHSKINPDKMQTVIKVIGWVLVVAGAAFAVRVLYKWH